MKSEQPSEYLQAKVMTASPAQLHLMLIEGALRFGRQAEKGLLRGDEVAAQPPLMRTLDIVEELLAGVRHDSTEINAKMAQLYAFVYRELTSTYVNFDHKRMAEALEILDFQRETWRLACEKAAAEDAKTDHAKAKAPAPKPHLGKVDAPTTGLSIEA